jgi:hypothetical protein
MRKKYAALALAVTLVFCSCGGRLPKPHTSEKLIYKHFKKYGKKYPDTIYGRQPVIKVEIDRQEEIRKHFAVVDAYVKLGDGTLRKINATVEKGPLGWHFVSWEDATGM